LIQATVLPGTHVLAAYDGLGQVTFTVNPDGTVSYAPALGQAGILAGQGTKQLTVNGAAVTIKATALSAPSLVVDYSTTVKTAALIALRLLPGSHLLESTDGAHVLWFTVHPDGTISYPSSEDALLSLYGTILIVKAWA
jgi:hypothetical protein